MTQPLRGIIWDVDGTLADTLPITIEVFRDVVARRRGGRRLSDEAIRDCFGPDEGGALREVVGDDWRAAEREFLDAYAARFDAMAEVFAGVPELLAACRDLGLRQAVVTGKCAESVRLTLDRLGLSAFFEPVMPGSPDGSIKVQNFRAVLDAWELPADAVVSVGDVSGDVRESRQVGLSSVLATWSPTPGENAKPDAPTPDATFATPDALLAWVRSRA